GIGTAAPGSILQIGNNLQMLGIGQYTGANADMGIYHNAIPSVFPTSTLKWSGTHASFGSRGIKFDFATGIEFYADTVATTAGTTFTPTKRMIIKNDGNVGIGTTSPLSKLSINGGLHIGGDSDAGDNNLLVDGTIKDAATYSQAVGATNRDLYIDDTGLFGYLSSSIRYKENVKTLLGSERIYGLNPVSFNYKAGGNGIGLIAEEVERVMSELVSYNDLGQPETVQYSQLPVYELDQLQKQNKRLEALEFQLTAQGLINASTTTVIGESGSGFMRMVNNALNSLGMVLQDGVATLKEAIADKITSKQIDGQQINSQRIDSRQIVTDQMCVKDSGNNEICLTGDQLKELVQKSGSSVTINQTYQAPVVPVNNGTTTAAGIVP
ncbi:MAG: tail fiber domain-containing protein, partial [Candidatus Paceibacterota bacterium]